jgi:large subunit ribosomal protein L16
MCITRVCKKEARLFIRVNACFTFTQKSIGTRMGSGKSGIAGKLAQVRAGQILFEIDGINIEAAKEALKKASYKLPLCTIFRTREFIYLEE